MHSEWSLKEFSKQQFPRTWECLNAGIAEGVAPGMVAGLWETRRSGEVRLAAVGQRRLVPSAQPMEIDTIFDLASVSKVFATATLTAVLVDRGWLRWDTPLKAFFPDYPYPQIQMRHLLSHTAGFPAWAPFWEKIRERLMPRFVHEVSIHRRQKLMRELVFAVAPEKPVGVGTLYSDISNLLLGFALEELTRMPLDHAVKRFVWEPMGIGQAYFRRVTRSPEAARDDRVAATENCPWRGGVLQGQVHDDNCWAMGGFGGHAGSFANAEEVLWFARQLLIGKFLTRRTRDAAWTRVSEPPGCDRALGWDTPSGDSPSASRLFSPRSVGHLGFTGTSLWIDPDAGISVTLLSNRVHPSRENAKFKDFRPRFHQAIREDLGY